MFVKHLVRSASVVLTSLLSVQEVVFAQEFAVDQLVATRYEIKLAILDCGVSDCDRLVKGADWALHLDSVLQHMLLLMMSHVDRLILAPSGLHGLQHGMSVVLAAAQLGGGCHAVVGEQLVWGYLHIRSLNRPISIQLLLQTL